MPLELVFVLEEETMEAKTKALEGAVLRDAADRFVRYGIAGLATQGDLADVDAARLLLGAVGRWFHAAGTNLLNEAEEVEFEDKEVSS